MIGRIVTTQRQWDEKGKKERAAHCYDSKRVCKRLKSIYEKKRKKKESVW